MARAGTTGRTPKIPSLTHAMVGIAGVAGCGVAALLVIYRDVLRSSFLSALSPEHSAAIVGAIVVATFFTAILAFYVWLAKHPSQAITGRIYVFLGIVIVLVGGALAGVWMVAPPVAPELPSLEESGRRSFQEGKFDQAFTEFHAAMRAAPENPKPAYWLGRVALHRGQPEIAERYFQVALDRDPTFEAASRGLLVVAILSSSAGAQAQAKALGLRSSPATASWLRCIRDQGMLADGFWTLTSITTACPLTES